MVKARNSIRYDAEPIINEAAVASAIEWADRVLAETEVAEGPAAQRPQIARARHRNMSPHLRPNCRGSPRRTAGPGPAHPVLSGTSPTAGAVRRYRPKALETLQSRHPCRLTRHLPPNKGSSFAN